MRESTVVFGGLGDDLEVATQLIGKEFATAKLRSPADSYFKGDEFKGQLFHRYDNIEAATATIKHFERTKLQITGQSIKCKPELPVDQRACLGMLLGLCYHLIEWGFDRKDIRVDDAIPMLSVAVSPVMNVSVADNAVSIDWTNETWEAWSDLNQAKNYKELVHVSNRRLSQAAEHKKKGTGKGKKGGAGASQ